MPLTRYNTRTFHRHLYGPGILETVTLYKRDDDQSAGTVRAVTLFDVRFSRVFKTGEPLKNDMASDHRAEIHIPRIELDRAGVNYINALDRFLRRIDGSLWQPESDTLVTVKLMLNHVCVQCRMLQGGS